MNETPDTLKHIEELTVELAALRDERDRLKAGVREWIRDTDQNAPGEKSGLISVNPESFDYLRQLIESEEGQ